MEALGDQVNWSAVASSAFRAKVAEIETRRKKSMSKTDVVKRLKALQGQGDEEEYKAGKDAGREWAERVAKPKELKRLAGYIEQFARNSVSWWDVDYPGWNAPWGATGSFVLAIWPSRENDRDAPDEFWETALGEDAKNRIDDADFFRGFGEGALEVWQEVEGEL
jgi:hypothetical protein